jgi:hypothetical protein
VPPVPGLVADGPGVTVGVGDGLPVRDGEGVALLDGVGRRDDGVRLGLADWVGVRLTLGVGDDVEGVALGETVPVPVPGPFGGLLGEPTKDQGISSATKKMVITAVEVRTRRYLCIRDRISSHRSSRRCRGWPAG